MTTEVPKKDNKLELLEYLEYNLNSRYEIGQQTFDRILAKIDSLGFDKTALESRGNAIVNEIKNGINNYNDVVGTFYNDLLGSEDFKDVATNFKMYELYSPDDKESLVLKHLRQGKDLFNQEDIKVPEADNKIQINGKFYDLGIEKIRLDKLHEKFTSSLYTNEDNGLLTEKQQKILQKIIDKALPDITKKKYYIEYYNTLLDFLKDKYERIPISEIDTYESPTGIEDCKSVFDIVIDYILSIKDALKGYGMRVIVPTVTTVILLIIIFLVSLLQLFRIINAMKGLNKTPLFIEQYNYTIVRAFDLKKGALNFIKNKSGFNILPYIVFIPAAFILSIISFSQYYNLREKTDDAYKGKDLKYFYIWLIIITVLLFLMCVLYSRKNDQGRFVTLFTLFQNFSSINNSPQKNEPSFNKYNNYVKNNITKDSTILNILSNLPNDKVDSENTINRILTSIISKDASADTLAKTFLALVYYKYFVDVVGLKHRYAAEAFKCFSPTRLLLKSEFISYIQTVNGIPVLLPNKLIEFKSIILSRIDGFTNPSNIDDAILIVNSQIYYLNNMISPLSFKLSTVYKKVLIFLSTIIGIQVIIVLLGVGILVFAKGFTKLYKMKEKFDNTFKAKPKPIEDIEKR